MQKDTRNAWGAGLNADSFLISRTTMCQGLCLHEPAENWGWNEGTRSNREAVRVPTLQR